MDDPVLGVLRFGLLGLLYLFFGRVMWAVWNQVRTPLVVATPRAQTVHRVEAGAPAGELDLSAGPVDIGRDSTCGLARPHDAYLSQHHCRVGRDQHGVWICDLESTNGTFVNGRRISAMEPLTRGARITAGSVVLEAR